MTRSLSFFLALVGLAACAPPGVGSVRFIANAEENVERGFAPSLLVDLWAITFTRYLVSLSGVELSRDGRTLRDDSRVVVDLQKGRVETHLLEDVPAGRWGVGFDVAPPGEGTVAGPAVSDEDVARLRTEGWAYWLEGRATKTGVGSFTFSLGFPLQLRTSECTNGVDGTLGLIVSEGHRTESELTIHADHMLYDRLGTHRGVQLRFDAWTADAVEGTPITREALRRQRLVDLRDRSGQPLRDPDGALVTYDPGSYSVDTLDDFVLQSLRDQVHLNGGGLCRVTPLEGS